eukprot:1156278-Pelagomonas_calceolata.AAC.1
MELLCKLGSENTPYINQGNGDTLAYKVVRPEGKREASVGLLASWQHSASGHQKYYECFCFQRHVCLSCQAGVVLLITSLLPLILQSTWIGGKLSGPVWVSRARSDQDSVRAAGDTSSLIKEY